MRDRIYYSKVDDPESWPTLKTAPIWMLRFPRVLLWYRRIVDWFR